MTRTQAQLWSLFWFSWHIVTRGTSFANFHWWGVTILPAVIHLYSWVVRGRTWVIQLSALTAQSEMPSPNKEINVLTSLFDITTQFRPCDDSFGRLQACNWSHNWLHGSTNGHTQLIAWKYKCMYKHSNCNLPNKSSHDLNWVAPRMWTC